MSLPEMLVVVAVMGILAAIGVVIFSQVRAKTIETKNKRNAQSLVSIFNTAQAAGLNFHVPAGSAEDVAKNVAKGGLVPDGPFAGEFFGMNGISDDEVTEAAAFLNYDEPQELLIYNPTP